MQHVPPLCVSSYASSMSRSTSAVQCLPVSDHGYHASLQTCHPRRGLAMAHSTRVVLVLVLLGFGLFVAGSPARTGDYRLVDAILLPTDAEILFSLDIVGSIDDSQRYYSATATMPQSMSSMPRTTPSSGRSPALWVSVRPRRSREHVRCEWDPGHPQPREPALGRGWTSHSESRRPHLRAGGDDHQDHRHRRDQARGRAGL